MKKFLLLFAGLALLACSKDDDNLNPGGPNPDGRNLDTQDFMWKAMNLWYFWQGDVANLADDRFTSDEDYTAFLASETDPALFFNKHRVSFLSIHSILKDSILLRHLSLFNLFKYFWDCFWSHNNI